MNKYLDEKGLAKVLGHIKELKANTWVGTLDEWNNLPDSEKDKYDRAEIIDVNDTTGGEFIGPYEQIDIALTKIGHLEAELESTKTELEDTKTELNKTKSLEKDITDWSFTVGNIAVKKAVIRQTPCGNGYTYSLKLAFCEFDRFLTGLDTKLSDLNANTTLAIAFKKDAGTSTENFYRSVIEPTDFKMCLVYNGSSNNGSIQEKLIGHTGVKELSFTFQYDGVYNNVININFIENYLSNYNSKYIKFIEIMATSEYALLK